MQSSAPSQAVAAPQSSFNASASGAAANLAAMDAAIRGSGLSASGALCRSSSAAECLPAVRASSTVCLRTSAPDHSVPCSCFEARLNLERDSVNVLSAGPKAEASRPSESRGQGGLEAERSYSTAGGMTFDGSGVTAGAASARAPAQSEQSITAGGSIIYKDIQVLVPNVYSNANSLCSHSPSPPKPHHRPPARPAHSKQYITAGGDTLHIWQWSAQLVRPVSCGNGMTRGHCEIWPLLAASMGSRLHCDPRWCAARQCWCESTSVAVLSHQRCRSTLHDWQEASALREHGCRRKCRRSPAAAAADTDTLTRSATFSVLLTAKEHGR